MQKIQWLKLQAVCYIWGVDLFSSRRTEMSYNSKIGQLETLVDVKTYYLWLRETTTLVIYFSHAHGTNSTTVTDSSCARRSVTLPALQYQVPTNTQTNMNTAIDSSLSLSLLMNLHAADALQPNKSILSLGHNFTITFPLDEQRPWFDFSRRPAFHLHF